MGFAFPDVKKAGLEIMDRFGLSLGDTQKITGYCVQKRPDLMTAMITGDFSSVPAVAASVGVSLGDGVNTSSDDRQESKPEKITAEKTAKRSAGKKSKQAQTSPTSSRAKTSPAGSSVNGHGVNNSGDSDHGITAAGSECVQLDGVNNSPAASSDRLQDNKAYNDHGIVAARPECVQDTTSPARQESTQSNNGVHGSGITDMITSQAYDINGDSIECETVNPAAPSISLPADIVPNIKTMLQDYCLETKTDEPKKLTGLQWRGFCLSVGKWIQSTRVLEDREKERKQGGKIYHPELMSQYFEIWASLTTLYDKTPLPTDFIAFSGVSYDYFTDRQDKSLTSTQAQLFKKTMDAMQAGLLSHGADGRRNNVFDMFLLKSKFGYVETSQVIHTSAAAAVDASGLPVLGVNGDN